MKTFFVFACNQYYPSVAMEDFKESFETEEMARTYIEERELEDSYDYVDIINISKYM